MTVNETLAAMIRNWPTLYSSRLDALDRCFTESWGEVVDGNYIPESIGRDEGDKAPYEDEEKAVADSHSDIYRKSNPAKADAIEAHARLRARRRNVEIAFKIENADLLAMEDNSSFSSTPDFSSYNLNKIKIDALNDEWKAALVEYLNEVIRYDEKLIERSSENAEHRERNRSALKHAKEAAREGLIRLGLGAKEAETARKAAIDKLRAEALKFGFKLDKIDPDNMFA